jgi:hypothetical protein
MGAHSTQPHRLTDVGVRLAEQYVSVLDFVSRCAQAIDGGDWFYLYDKASQLEVAAGWLAEIGGETWHEISAGRPRLAPRPSVRRWPGSAASIAPPGCYTAEPHRERGER